MNRELRPGAEVAGLSAAELDRASAELELGSAGSVLRWTFDRFAAQRVALTSAFGPEGCVLIDLARRIVPDVRIYSIDTGLLFDEAIDVRESYRELGANIVVVEPLVTIRAQAASHGPDLHEREPDRCCAIRKVEPMYRILDQIDVWVTGIRRDQGGDRANVPIVGTVPRRDGSRVLKVAPLARWTRTDTWGHLLQNGLPYNRLLDQGYTSIGCRPCTQRPISDTSERAGRWQGRGKTECGIHSL